MGFVDDVIMGEPGSSKIDISALVIDLSEQLPRSATDRANLGQSNCFSGQCIDRGRLGQKPEDLFDRCRGFGISFFVRLSGV